MEESVQRRERLKAMRLEADESIGTSHDLNSNSTSTLPVHLSSPLLDPVAVVPPAAQRFDFYTDPMAAFSGNKRKNVETQQQTPPNYFSRPPQPPLNCSSAIIRPPSSLPGPRNLEMASTPSPQFQSSYSPVQRVYEAPPPYHSSRSSSGPNPVGFMAQFPGHQGTPPGVWNGPGGAGGYGFPPNSPNVGPFHSPGFGQGNTRPNLGTGNVHHIHNYPNPSGPRPDFGRGTGQQFHNYPNPSGPRPDFGRGTGQQFHNYPNPNWEAGCPRPYVGTGRAQWFNNNRSPDRGRGSPRTNSGRGSDRRYSHNPSSGSGRGSHACVSARESPNSFYNKSMVEDPWRSLKPVVRSIDSAKSWLPKSISTKRAKISEPARNISSEPSLAEFVAGLTASMEEATKDKTGIL